MVSKLLKTRSGLFIPDLDPDFLPIPDPDPRVNTAPDPGSGSATLISTQASVNFHCMIFSICGFFFLVNIPRSWYTSSYDSVIFPDKYGNSASFHQI
jgi:hypothetical protein